jgi:hypothetical protein
MFTHSAGRTLLKKFKKTYSVILDKELSVRPDTSGEVRETVIRVKVSVISGKSMSHRTEEVSKCSNSDR